FATRVLLNIPNPPPDVVVTVEIDAPAAPSPGVRQAAVVTGQPPVRMQAAPVEHLRRLALELDPQLLRRQSIVHDDHMHMLRHDRTGQNPQPAAADRLSE